jgi:hypothetical protein
MTNNVRTRSLTTAPGKLRLWNALRSIEGVYDSTTKTFQCAVETNTTARRWAIDPAALERQYCLELFGVKSIVPVKAAYVQDKTAVFQL